MLLQHLKEYFTISTVQGLRYIVENDRHYIERIFWIICCTMGWIGACKLTILSLDAYENNAVSFVMDTTFLEWSTEFPTVSVCEVANADNIADYATRVYGEERDYNLDEVVEEIAYFKGTCYFMKEFCSAEDVECPSTGYKEIANTIRQPCEKLLIECIFNNIKFNCCEYFLKKETEVGVCYTLSQPSERQEFNFHINRKNGLGNLEIKFGSMAQIYLHSKDDIPFYNSMTTEMLKTIPNVHMKHIVDVRDIINEPDLKTVAIRKRKCRFPDENYLTVSETYSYSACLINCRMQRQLEICNCTSHLMPRAKGDQICNYDGLICLNNHYNEFVVLKPRWEHRIGLLCDCLPSCDEREINIISREMTREDGPPIIQIIFNHFPTERFKRKLVRSNMDLIVSIGGAVNLFVGATVVSLAEFIYHFTLRLLQRCVAKSISETNMLETSPRIQLIKLGND